MNPVPALSFIARHFLFVVLASIAGCVLWTIAYVVLLAVAVIGGHGVGGPLAYPAGLFAVVAACVVLGWGIFAPASAVGLLVCQIFRWPRIAAIPLVFGAAFGLSFLLFRIHTGLASTGSTPSSGVVFWNFTVFLSIPLGIYWWLTEGPGALFDLFRRWISHRRKDKSATTATLPPR